MATIPSDDIGAEGETEALAAHLAAIVASSSDAIISKTLDGVVTSWNAGARHLFGYSAQEIVGRSIALLIPPDRMDEEMSLLTRIGAGERIDHYETVRLSRDGQRLDVSLTISPLRDSRGKVIGASKILRDITARKRAELALKKTENALLQSQVRMRHAAEAAGVTYVQFERATQWVRVGENFGRVTGYKPRALSEGGGFEVARSGLLDHVAAPDRPAVSAMIDDGFAGGSGKLQFRVIGDEGGERWIEADWRPELADDGSTAGVFATCLDITAAKAAKQALFQSKLEAERANRAKSDFLAAASHDLRQPVQSLNLLMAVIKRQAADRPQVAQAADLAEASIKSLNDMLTGFLDISRLDAGAIQPVMASVDVGETVSRLAREYGPRAAAKGLGLRCRLSDFHARTDAVLLERILRNLIENALRYTDKGGVLIGLRPRGDRVRLDVIDTGIGIPADKHAEIFEEFRQLGNPARNANQGLGLGLAIVSRLASLLGAELQVSSRLGRGARFSLLLPRERTGPVAIETEPAIDHPRGRVLVIEDVATLRMAYEMMLRFSGYDVFGAENGEVALALAAQEDWRFDAIVADQRLGAGWTGAETAKEIRRRAGWAIPTMIVTGETGRESLTEISASGFALLHKPIDADELCGALAALIVS